MVSTRGVETGSFEEFFEAQRSRAYRTAWVLLGDEEDAKDVAQETLARAFASWSKLTGLSRPDLWITRVACNLANSRLRRLRLERTRRQNQADRRTTGFETQFESDTYVLGLLKALPNRQRVAVVLRHCLDFSVSDTAQIMAVRPGTVKALTSQGIARLKEEIQGDGSLHG